MEDAAACQTKLVARMNEKTLFQEHDIIGGDESNTNHSTLDCRNSDGAHGISPPVQSQSVRERFKYFACEDGTRQPLSSAEEDGQRGEYFGWTKTSKKAR